MNNINAKEILEIAIQNEMNGVEFYAGLSENVSDINTKKALVELSKQEAEHVETVKKLINKLVEDNKKLDYYDDPEELLYLHAIADSAMGHSNEIPTFTDNLAALHYAVSLEIKSIEFYKQLLQMLQPDTEQNIVEILIKQEKTHVKELYKLIKEHE